MWWFGRCYGVCSAGWPFDSCRPGIDLDFADPADAGVIRAAIQERLDRHQLADAAFVAGAGIGADANRSALGVNGDDIAAMDGQRRSQAVGRDRIAGRDGADQFMADRLLDGVQRAGGFFRRGQLPEFHVAFTDDRAAGQRVNGYGHRRDDADVGLDRYVDGLLRSLDGEIEPLRTGPRDTTSGDMRSDALGRPASGLGVSFSSNSTDQVWGAVACSERYLSRASQMRRLIRCVSAAATGLLVATRGPRDDGLDRDFARTREAVFRQVHPAQQQQVLDLAEFDDSLFRGGRGGKELDRRQGGGLPRRR